MSILVTGGAGYIGSHTCIELLNAGYDIAVVDNLCNSSREALLRAEKITGKALRFYQTDLRQREELTKVFEREKIDAVIHFAGLKAVGESVHRPLEYYHNNITGSLVLLEVMKCFGVKDMVFSSSATVYGNPDSVPIREDFPLSATNPYGRTKLMLEEIFRDLYSSDQQWNIILLRYFNPIGAHSSGLIGENPRGIPNNLVPYITQTAVGKLEAVGVFGNDYDTPDGSGVRDFIHVVDLACGHVKAIEKLREKPGIRTYNLGTGTGYSVFDMIKAFSGVCGRDIPYVIKPRRPGDIAACYADASLAARELGWTAQKNLEEMCADSWRWQKNNPNGYDDQTVT